MITDYGHIVQGLPVMFLLVVVAMTSIADVEAMDITAGYPEKLNLTPQWLQSHT